MPVTTLSTHFQDRKIYSTSKQPSPTASISISIISSPPLLNLETIQFTIKQIQSTVFYKKNFGANPLSAVNKSIRKSTFSASKHFRNPGTLILVSIKSLNQSTVHIPLQLNIHFYQKGKKNQTFCSFIQFLTITHFSFCPKIAKE